MKKVMITLLILCSLTACSPAQSNITTTTVNKSTANEVQTTTTTTVSKADSLKLPDQAEIGEGKITLKNQSGSTEKGESIVILNNKLLVTSIGIDHENFDGKIWTYIFVDGKENDKGQYGKMGSGSLQLKGDALNEGMHAVEVIQWTGEDMTQEVAQYKRFEYQVKK